MLLHGQGLTIERPARATGTAIGTAATGIALILALALLFRGLGWPVSFPQFLAYLGAGLMVVVALAFAFWTYSCATLRYAVDTAGVSIHWGPVTHRVPAWSIVSTIRGRVDQTPRISGIGWLGYHVGRGEVQDHNDLLFFSTHRSPEEIVYIKTPLVTYAVSPQEPGRFIASIERARQAVAGQQPTENPAVARDLFAAHPIWSDRIAQYLALGAVLLNVALWGYLFATYPGLSNEITIEFPPIGDIATLESRDDILKIPATATAMLVANIVAALLFQPRERAATYLVLSGTVFFQVVFWVAAIVAVVNA